MRTLEKIDVQPNSAYPAQGRNLAELAAVIRANVGLQVAWLDAGGWDTHVGQRAQLARRLDVLGRSLAAFRRDLGAHYARVVVLVMSEFGRTVAENGSGGTDHGHGTAMLVLGGPVRGGRVLGRFAGLAPDQLFEGRDLAVTTDFRDLFAELAARHLRTQSLSQLFPGYAPSPSRFPGALGA